MGTARPKRRGDKAAGYTLMEIAICSSIAAVMAGISMPAMLNTIQTYRADGAPRQLMGDLRYAQSHAIARGMEARVVIYSATGVATGSG